MKEFTGQKGSFTALLPLLFFVFIFLGAGIYLDDFYALPSPIAVILRILMAFLILMAVWQQRFLPSSRVVGMIKSLRCALFICWQELLL